MALSLGARPWVRVSLLLSVLWTLAAIGTLLPMASPIPTWDVWAFVDEWDAWRLGQPVLPLVSTPYNGHLLLVPRLLILAIGDLTGFDMSWIQAANLLLAATTLALLVVFLRQVDRRLTALAIVATACVFSMIQYASLLAPVSIGQQICQLLTTLTLLLLAAPEIGWGRFGVALTAAALGSLSFGSGLVVWVVGAIALASEVKPSPARLALWISTALVFAVLISAVAGGRSYMIPLHPGRIAECVLVLLGHLLQPGSTPDPGEAMALGFSILCFAVLAFGICLTSPTLRPALRPWGLLGLQGLGAAVLIALARSHGGLEAGLRSQYFTAVYPIVIALAGLTGHAALLASDRSPGSLGARLAGAACLVVTLVAVGISAFSFHTLPPILWGWRVSGGDAVRVLVDGAADDELIRRFFHPSPPLVRRGLGLLAEHRLSVFKGIPGRGRPIGDVDAIRGGRMETVDGTLDGRAGHEMEGWVASSGDQAIEKIDLCLAGTLCGPVHLGAPGSHSGVPGAARFTLAIPPLPAGTEDPASLVLVAQDRAGIRIPIFHAVLRP